MVISCALVSPDRDLLNLKPTSLLGPNELSIRHADAVVPIYGPNGWDKGPAYNTISQLREGEPALQDLRTQ